LRRPRAPADTRNTLMVCLGECVQEAEMSDKAEADSYPHVAVFGVEGAASRATPSTPRYDGQPGGGLVMRKIGPPVTELKIFQTALQQKEPPPLCTDKGSHIVGAHLIDDYKDQKKSASRTTHTAIAKLSPAQSPHCPGDIPRISGRTTTS